MNRNKSFENNYLLYLIATPIGNLSEFSNRAIEIINEMDLIACEDTRNTQKLLSFFNIKKELVSLHEHNEVSQSKFIIEQIKQGKKVAYVSDAGYPCISDPGNILVKLALEEGISCSTISGSSAFLNALVSSGLSTEHFYFHGFLSSNDSEAKKELENLSKKQETLIFYESPHRIARTLKLYYEIFGDRKAVISRELTKLHEEQIRGTLSEFINIEESSLKGEIVVIIDGAKNIDEISDEQIKKRFEEIIKLGVENKAAIEIVSQELNVNKNRVKKLIFNK